MIRTLRWGALLTLLAFAFVIAKNREPILYPDLVKPKQAVVISPSAIQYLEKHQTDGTVKVWVFFTDKGIYDKAHLESATLSATQSLTPRALARRLKHGVTGPEFADLAVNQKYVDLVTNTGAKLRRVSKWLNAASFEVNKSALGFIGNFPFVERIQPVAAFKKSYDPPTEGKPSNAPQKSILDAQFLEYGSSYGQLQQISVPACHDSGYFGQGMIVSMFDSGFRTTHNSFSHILAEGRLLAKYDFIFNDTIVDNQANDDPGAWSHGTSTWSACGGENPTVHYGPAFKASFILCKTEDIRSETPIEEDNWVRAVEFVDSIGTDIISSSLGYTDWYTTSDYNGRTCVTTLAALQAARYGILVCNSIGNSGPGATSMGAPADADSILSVGAVYSTGGITYFSSRGPTYDGRMKPEVCAQGASCYLASATSNSAYSYGDGTSFSCPLTAGAAAVIWGAHPTWTNQQVRQAMMLTASRAATPDNTYGWGIVNAWSALHVVYGPPVYVHGDANGDGSVDISDAVYLITYIFGNGAAPNPIQAGDADCSSGIDIADAVYLINYIFREGPDPC